MNQPSKPDGSVRGVLHLTIGSVVARAMSAISQILLVFWLLPNEFGYWAAVSSAVGLIAGLTNLGEVNAYLAGRIKDYQSVRKSTLKVNLILGLAGSGIAAIYWVQDGSYLGLLAVTAAFAIPLQGRADLLYAVGVKYKEYRRLVLAQVLAALTKLVVGILLAVYTNSAIALGLSALVFFIVMDLSLAGRAKKITDQERPSTYAVPKRERYAWAANTLSMTLPLQIGFLLAQFIAPADILGLYFVAFQMTLGLSGLVAMPLARIALSSLSNLSGRDRIYSALRLCHIFGIVTLVVCVIISLTMPILDNYVPDSWSLAIPAFMILLSSMPARLMSPVVDSFQQASNRWWQSTVFNLIDAFGTAIASLSAFTGDILLLTLSIAGWKILFTLARFMFVFRGAGILTLLGLVIPSFVGAISFGMVHIPFFSTPHLMLLLASSIVFWMFFIKKYFSSENNY